MKLKVSVIALSLCFFLMMFSLFPFCWAVDENQARQAMVRTDQTIKDCYLAVAAADKAGGNVTDLLLTLQYAGILLSSANLAFERGDFDSAYNLAVQSKSEMDGVVADANFLKNSAEERSEADFLINVLGSSVGTVAILVGSFALWLVLKRRYGKEQANSIES